MPRKTRRQLVGKQEDIEREAREAEIRDLAWELQLVWVTSGENSGLSEVEPTEHAVSQCQAEIMPLTVPIGTR